MAPTPPRAKLAGPTPSEAGWARHLDEHTAGAENIEDWFANDLVLHAVDVCGNGVTFGAIHAAEHLLHWATERYGPHGPTVGPYRWLNPAVLTTRLYLDAFNHHLNNGWYLQDTTSTGGVRLFTPEDQPALGLGGSGLDGRTVGFRHAEVLHYCDRLYGQTDPRWIALADAYSTDREHEDRVPVHRSELTVRTNTMWNTLTDDQRDLAQALVAHANEPVGFTELTGLVDCIETT